MANSAKPPDGEPESKLTPELVVSDYTASLAFYTDILGFAVDYARPEQRFAMLNRDGARIMIEQPVDRSWITAELARPYGRGINFQIEVGDVAALYAHCIANRTPLFMDMEDAWYRRNDHEVGNRQFLLQDPDGYLLRFFQHLGERPIP